MYDFVDLYVDVIVFCIGVAVNRESSLNGSNKIKDAFAKSWS